MLQNFFQVILRKNEEKKIVNYFVGIMISNDLKVRISPRDLLDKIQYIASNDMTQE